MSKPSNTREQIIEKAFELMLQRGLNGFSYRDISEPLGVKNAAIHYHFPSKSDLLKALIDESHELLKESTAGFMAYGGPAGPQLEGYFAHTLHQYDCGRPLCMVGALSVDYEELSDEIKAANDRFMKDMGGWLEKVMETGREQGEFSFRGSAKMKALSILAMTQGARQLARIHGRKILEKLFSQVRVDLGIED